MDFNSVKGGCSGITVQQEALTHHVRKRYTIFVATANMKSPHALQLILLAAQLCGINHVHW